MGVILDTSGLIAALALQHGMKVMTLNAKDFTDILGLAVLAPVAGR